MANSKLLFYNFFNFDVFDATNTKLLYSKYSFNFDLYSKDFNLENNKQIIFADFLKKNSVDYTKPIAVKAELTKYFKQVTQAHINYLNKYGYCFHANYFFSYLPGTFIDCNILVKNQFDMVQYTNEEIIIIQDFIIELENKMYTKWNFDFINYSNDLNVYGSKLFVFTDFINRCLHLNTSESISIGPSGYNIPEGFEKYFLNVNNTEELRNYIIDNGITSINKYITKNIYDIDYLDYGKINQDLAYLKNNNFALQNHFNTYGQFELKKVTLLQKNLSEIDAIKGAVGTIFTKSGLSTGFLYDNGYGDNNIYLISCFHILKKLDDFNTIKATFQNNNSNVTAEFKMIGHDIYTDIFIGIFDANLEYNKSRNIDLSNFPKIKINSNYKLNIGDNIITLSNIGFNNDLSYLNGTIMDPLFSGSFNKISALAIPNTILLNMYISAGCSGSPIFTKDINNNLICVGMLNGSFTKEKQYSSALDGSFLQNFANYSARKWVTYIDVYRDEKSLYMLTRFNLKRWLGILYSYFHPQLSVSQYPILTSLKWVGGLVVHNFILGFDYTNYQFVTNYKHLTKKDVIEMKTPLLDTKMYNRFINNNKHPIVIKSATFFDGNNSEYKKFYFGKFAGQDSYARFMYGLIQYMLRPNPEYLPVIGLTPLLFNYNDITIEYYYFNNIEWILDTEIISGNGPDKYNKYSTSLNNQPYIQHTLEYPQILLAYDASYPDIMFSEGSEGFSRSEGSEGFKHSEGSEGFSRSEGSEGFSRSEGSEGFRHSEGSEGTTRY